MDITNKTEVELKALAWDLNCQIQAMQRNLQVVVNEMQKFQKKEVK